MTISNEQIHDEAIKEIIACRPEAEKWINTMFNELCKQKKISSNGVASLAINRLLRALNRLDE